MIGKVLQNNNFRETTHYVLVKEKARLLGSAVLESEAEAIAQEFRLSRDLNPAIERPVYHLIESYSYEDTATKRLTDEFQLERAIEHFAGLVVSARAPELLRQDDKTAYKQQVNDFIETELYEYQWFCATHEDTKHTHTHFVASRINLIDGRCIPTWQDKERSHRICREMEREHGLQPLQSFYDLERRSPTRKQRDKWDATGVPPVMVVMQEAIDREVTPGRSLEEVITNLKEKHGIAMTVGASNGQTGVVFAQVDGHGETVRLSGSQLGRGYTHAAIGRRLEPERASELELPPPAVATKLEQTIEAIETSQKPDPLARVMREQAGYAERLAPQLQELWEREQAGRPKLNTATFEEYQIRLSEEGQPSLYRRDRLLLGHAKGEYQAYGLTEQDCTVMERFNTVSKQQVQERLQQLDFQQRQQERQQEKVKSRSQEEER